MKKEIVMELKGKEWEEMLDHVWEHKKKDISMDGFRKGQVPKDIYIKKVGIESLFMDAVDHAIPVLYDKLLKENADLEIAARPSVDVKSIDKDHVAISFSIVLKPEVKLGKYKDLKIKKEEATVTDEEVENELNHLREQFVELKDKDGKVQEGDEVTIDFEGFKDGVAFDGGKGTDYPLVIGSHSFIPGFEEGIVGMELNEEKDLELTFPDNYPSAELKGQKVTFKVKVKGIKERVLPEYDEEFFKDLNMPDVDSLDKLKEELKNHIKGHKEADIEDRYFEECLTKVSENATIDIPEEMILDEVDRITEDFSQRLEMQGMNLDTYLKMLNMDLETFKGNFKDEATKRVRFRLCIESVVKAEDIKVEDEELNNYSKEMAEKYKVSEEEFLSQIGGKDFLKYDLEVRKALEIITK